jgi:CubicO group peptidase (beta-lactamase class C family)
MNLRWLRVLSTALAGLVLVTAVAACGEPVVADPHNPGGFITPAPSSAPASTAPTPTAPTPSHADLHGVEPRTLDNELLAELDAYIEDAMKRYQVPGVEVAVVQNGKIVHLNSFGVREVGKPDPVTPNTLMKIGSVTKSMTTLMIANLVDEGRLSWDTPVTEILPWFETSDPALTPQITVRDLVSNSTGLMRRDTEMIFNASKLDAEAVVRSIKTFAFEPDSEFRKTFGYSNQMVATGGYAAAHTAPGGTGNLYADYLAQMQRRVFGPIGMRNTTFSLETAVSNPDHASPHGFNLDYTYASVPIEQEEMLTPFAPAGAAWSNATDMARYLITELNRGVASDGTRVVSEANLNKTWTAQVDLGNGKGYGLGWFTTDFKGQPRIGHGGDTIGYSSNLDFMPEAGIGVVVLTNAGGMSAFGGGVAGRLYELAFDQPFEIDAKVAAYFGAIKQGYLEAASAVQPRIDPSEVAPFQGTYRNADLGEVTLTFRAGKLTFQAASFSSELGSIGDGSYMFLNPPMPAGVITLSRDDHGERAFVYVTNNPDAPGSWEFAGK